MRLSEKQWDYVLGSTAFLNIADGAVRSGKTHSCLIRFGEYCVSGPPGDLMILGKTERTLRRNVIAPLRELFGKRLRYVQGTGEMHLAGRLIHVVGAADARAEEKVRGATLAGAYCNELTLFPENVFKTLIDRCSVPGAKIFADTNPDSPFHWLMTDYLARADGRDVARFRFQLDDNPILSEEYKARLRRMHHGMWRKRMVEGEWVQAEGAIFDMFDADRHVVSKLPDTFERHMVSIDYGTANPTVFLLWGLAHGKWYIVKEYYHDSRSQMRQKTDAEYSADLERFVGPKLKQRVPIIVDPSAASFIAQLRRDGFRVRKADNAVLDGIRVVSTALAEGELLIHNSCKTLISEMTSYVWDPKAQQRGQDKPLEQNDHGPDALRYGAMHVLGRPQLQVVPKPEGW